MLTLSGRFAAGQVVAQVGTHIVGYLHQALCHFGILGDHVVPLTRITTQIVEHGLADFLHGQIARLTVVARHILFVGSMLVGEDQLECSVGNGFEVVFIEVVNERGTRIGILLTFDERQQADYAQEAVPG